MQSTDLRPILTALTILILAACSPRYTLSPVNVDQVPILTGTRTVPVDEVQSIALSPQGTMLIIGGENGAFAYSTSNHQELWHQSFQGIEYVTFSPDGNSIILIEDTDLALWLESVSGELLEARELRLLSSATYAPSGDLLAFGVWGGGILVWDTQKRGTIFTSSEFDNNRQAGGQNTFVHWSSDSRFLFAGGWYDVAAAWNIETGELSQTFEADSPIANIALSPDDSRLAAIAEDGTRVNVWFVDSGVLDTQLLDTQLLMPDRPPENVLGQSILGLAWSPDGAYIAAAGFDGDTYLWSTTDYSLVQVLEQPRNREFERVVTTLAWHPDGDLLYAGTADGKIFVWDMTSYQLVETLTGF